MSRRAALRAGATGLVGASWLTHLAEALALEHEATPGSEPAGSLIFLWLGGGPSQLETFDPKPGTRVAGGTRAIATSVAKIQLAEGLPLLAEQMQDVSLVRSLVSKEGDHERGAYLMKTGYRPDPTVIHPSIGAICCQQLPENNTEIPRHVAILSGQFPPRGGYLGNQFDAFKTFDPRNAVPDIKPRVPPDRQDTRLADRELVDRAFAAGRGQLFARTMHGDLIERARRMMGSEQLAAFDVSQEPGELQKRYGDTPFGRGCLAARRLVEQGVRCVEVTLEGWDSHINNHEIHRGLLQQLDPAFSALIADLRERKLLERTVVLCGGEFGRTPRINGLDGRDHWPTGFSMALAGGRIRGGHVVGETAPEGDMEQDKKRLTDPHPVADVHATVLAALGLDPAHELLTPIGRPLKLSEGTPIAELVVEG